MTWCQASAMLLAKRPLSEYKEIWEFFSDKHGRLSLVVPLSRRYRHLDYGQLLDVAWRPGAALPTVRSLELQQCFGVFSADTGIFILYLNELLRNLLPEHEAHPQLFQHYTSALKILITAEKPQLHPAFLRHATAGFVCAPFESQKPACAEGFASSSNAASAATSAESSGAAIMPSSAEYSLRRFELLLLSDLGFALPLEKTQDGQMINHEKIYAWHIPEGASGEVASRVAGDLELSGQVLKFLTAWRETPTPALALSASQWQSLKTLLRATLAYYLAGKSLQTRKLWQLLHS